MCDFGDYRMGALFQSWGLLSRSHTPRDLPRDGGGSLMGKCYHLTQSCLQGLRWGAMPPQPGFLFRSQPQKRVWKKIRWLQIDAPHSHHPKVLWG